MASRSAARPLAALGARAAVAMHVGVAACSVLPATLCHAQPAATAGSPFRYDDDSTTYADAAGLYARLKYVPLGDAGYASFGADLRERVEASDGSSSGNGHSDVYDLHRLLVFGDLQLGPHLRAFVQLGDHDEAGRSPGPSPLDVDRLDLAQAFVDVAGEAAGGRAVLRLGRAEMSFDDGALIGLRDGPNVRQVWDGGRLNYTAGAWRWVAFAVRPVAVKPGVFDDGPVPGQSLKGLHLTVAPPGPLAADAFVYHDLMPQAALFGAAGRERTNTFGLRLRAHTGFLDGSVGAIGQTGDAAGRDVRAFALHADAGLSLRRVPWSPHISLRADVLSGGDAKASHVATFNALYPMSPIRRRRRSRPPLT